MLQPPYGFDEIVKLYTLPTRDNTGHVTEEWKLQNLTIVTSPFPLHLSWAAITITKITIHKLLVDPLLAALNDVNTAGLADFLGKDYGGSYNDRPIRGSSTHISMHAFGAALDFRVKEDPMGDTIPEPEMQDKIVPIFTKYGWFWGGDFQGRKDPEHFQFGSGY